MCRVIEDMCNKAYREGIHESAIEIARRMLAAGRFALEEISEISGLSLDEVKKLQTGQSV